MKQLHRGFALLLCLVLCAVLIPSAAFAESVVIIPGADSGLSGSGVSGSSSAVSDGFVLVFGDGRPSSGGAASSSSASTSGQQVITDFASNQPVSVQADGSIQAIGGASGQTVVRPEASVSGLALEIFNQTNTVRAENGLSALRYNPDLQNAANIRARESATSFSHIRPDGSKCDTVLSEFDYVIAGENLLLVTKEYANASLILETWMNSGTHRANIVQSAFTQIAIGIYESEGTVFVSQIFLG